MFKGSSLTKKPRKNIMIKYKNYEIEKIDQHNWQVKSVDTLRAKADAFHLKTGKLIRKKGEVYESKATVGYFSSLEKAVQGIMRERIGSDCHTLEEVVCQVRTLRSEIKELLSYEV